MAKVFTPEQVAFNRIPHPDGFKLAAEVLLENLISNTSLSDTTDGALVFGSTTTDNANRRSDLDVLVSHRGKDSWYVNKMGLILKHIDATFNIPVEPIVYSHERFASGDHTIDPIFANHLRSVDAIKWGVGNNPTKNLVVDNSPWTDIFERYTLHKESKFKKALMSVDNAVDYRVLQRAYEIPSALGRKALALLASETDMYMFDIDPHSAPKDLVINVVRSIASTQTFQALNKIIDANNEYNERLDDAIGGGSARILKYGRWLHASYRPTVSYALDYTNGLRADVKQLLVQQNIP